MSYTPDDLAVIVIAAGISSRLGMPKQLVELPNGKNLLENTLFSFEAFKKSQKFLVLGAYRQKILKSTDLEAWQILENENYKEGMGSSISCGIEAILSTGYKGVILSVGDQAFIHKSIIDQLVNSWIENPHVIIRSKYILGFGPPILFPKTYFPLLHSLIGDHGAKSFLQKHKPPMSTISFPLGAIDIDDVEDLKQVKEQWIQNLTK